VNDAVSFEDWIKLIFDHPVDSNREWYWEIDANVAPVDAPTFIKYTAQLFLASGELLKTYSDAQVNQGLNVLISNGVSDNIFALQNKSIPLEQRTAFLNAIFDLNEQCFQARCTPHLSHLDRTETPPHVSCLNMICYMWWDVFVTPGGALNDACISVMEKCLRLTNPAVLEGALHGLGHWSLDYPERCEAIIDEFLKSRANDFSRELRAYASAARTGCIQ
jgi:hypothetical protein